mgnify:CR=1 FL=1
MSLPALFYRHSEPSFPRVSGDEPMWTVMQSRGCRFSPRERG